MATDPSLPLHQRRQEGLVLAIVFVAFCVAPYMERLRYPSLYADDVARIILLQTKPLPALAIMPFNEHFSPSFHVVSWVSWQLAAERLTWAPLLFTLASYVPFGLSLLVLERWLRRELGPTTAFAALAVFSLSALSVESVLWFSASSFMWSLLCALIALMCAGRSAGADSRRGDLVLCAIAAAVAPSFSAIGVLAGPLAAIKALLVSNGQRWRPRLVRATVPLAGTFAFLAVASAFRYRDIVSTSLQKNADLRVGVRSLAQAVIERLVPGLVGVRVSELAVSENALWGVFGLLTIAAAVWAVRSRHRSLIVVGLAAITGGYLLTYSTRSGILKDNMINVQRYHLFPQFGLALLVSVLIWPWLRRFDARPRTGRQVAIALAAILLMLHARQVHMLSRGFRFPEERQTLVALERLAETCRREGITREQALRALDPTQTRWMDHPTVHALQMLPETVSHAALPDEYVRDRLLASLSPEDREGLCGGMDATPHLTALADSDASTPCAEGRLVRSLGMKPSGPAGEFVSAGWPAYLEFDLPQGASARVLCLPHCPPGASMEVWWTSRAQKWSPTRSARLHSAAANAAQPWVLPLAALPHWTPSDSLQIRLLFHDEGLAAVGEPRLLR